MRAARVRHACGTGPVSDCVTAQLRLARSLVGIDRCEGIVAITRTIVWIFGDVRKLIAMRSARRAGALHRSHRPRRQLDIRVQVTYVRGVEVGFDAREALVLVFVVRFVHTRLVRFNQEVDIATGPRQRPCRSHPGPVTRRSS